MAQIIDFQTARNSRPAIEAAPGEGAEILFFLGVRYVRMETPVEPTNPEKAVRRSRKKRA